MKRYRAERRDWLDSLKANIPCVRCGTVYPPYVMEWHHRDRSAKLFKLSRGQHITNKQKILNEIAKCDLYCSNCHKIIEYERERSESNRRSTGSPPVDLSN